MSTEIGLPTRAAHLRLWVNPIAIERTPGRMRREWFTVYVNGRPAEAARHASPTWVDRIIGDLERRTDHGTIAPGTYVELDQYPRPDALRRANEELAARGISLEIQPHFDDSGLLRAWIQYQHHEFHR